MPLNLIIWHISYMVQIRNEWVWLHVALMCLFWPEIISSLISHLIMEVWWGGGQHAAVGFEHVTLDVDGEVTELAVLSLLVQAAQHRALSAGEAHLHHRATCVSGGGAAAAAAAHLHGQGLHLGGRNSHDCQFKLIFGIWFDCFLFYLQFILLSW